MNVCVCAAQSGNTSIDLSIGKITVLINDILHSHRTNLDSVNELFEGEVWTALDAPVVPQGVCATVAATGTSP